MLAARPAAIVPANQRCRRDNIRAAHNAGLKMGAGAFLTAAPSSSFTGDVVNGLIAHRHTKA
jgi:hypothetical protein